MSALPEPAPRRAIDEAAPPPWLRGAVRDILERSQGYHALTAEERRSLAQAMVKLSTVAATLIAQEHDAEHEIARQRVRPAPLARAQEDQPQFGTSADRIAGITRNVLGAVSFPRFVTDLINGVFRAMLDSNSQQMRMYVDLLNNVSASLTGFERTQFSTGSVREWIAQQFPDQIEYDVPEVEPGEEPDPEEVAQVTLRLRPNASMPGEEELRAALGLEPNASIDAPNPEALVPLARRQMARQRQSMLATMVMLGMQRIVIDSGRITAAMRFHIDTRSAASEDRGSEFGMQNRVRASGSYGVGPWGVSAAVENNISYVSTQRTQRTEEINTDLELNSSVELNFRTDYLPLNQMAASAQADRIRNASLNPAAPAEDPARARQQRLDAQIGAERERRTGLQGSIDAARRPPERPVEPVAATIVPRDTSGSGSGGSGTSGGGTTSGGTTSGTSTSGTSTTGAVTSGSTTSGSSTTGSTTAGSSPSGTSTGTSGSTTAAATH